MAQTCACGAQWERPIGNCPLCESGMKSVRVTFLVPLNKEEVEKLFIEKAMGRKEKK